MRLWQTMSLSVLCSTNVIGVTEEGPIVCVEEEGPIVCVEEKGPIVCVKEERPIVCVTEERSIVCVEEPGARPISDFVATLLQRTCTYLEFCQQL